MNTPHPTRSGLSRRQALAGLSAGGLGLVLTSRGRLIAAQEATPAMAGEIPPVVQAWVDAWNSEDLDAFLALYTEDALFEEPAFGVAAQGTDAIRAVIEEEFVVFEDISMEVTSAFQAGDMAAAEGIFSATYANQGAGLPPASGQPITVRVGVIFELEDDLIKRDTEYFDAYSFLIQVGALPAPGEAAAEATPAQR